MTLLTTLFRWLFGDAGAIPHAERLAYSGAIRAATHTTLERD